MTNAGRDVYGVLVDYPVGRMNGFVMFLVEQERDRKEV